MSQNKLSRTKKIIIIVVAAILIAATAVTVPLVVLSKNGKLTFSSIDVPNISVLAVTAEPDYTVTLSWNEVLGAVGYHVQYYYDYEVKDVANVKDEEITTFSLKATSKTIGRIKGNLHFRVEACANNASHDSGYGEWQTYTVPALTLSLPKSFELARVSINGTQCYKATEYSRNEWSCVTYTYKGVTYDVNFYEIVIVSPDKRDNPNFSSPQIFNRASLLKNEYYFTTSGVWTVYLRAVNYAEINGEAVPLETQLELVTLYDIADEWTKIETTVIIN